MKDLHLYVSMEEADAPGGQVFYSRRGDGPFYLWRYDGTPRCWRFSRVCPSRLARRSLRSASWQAVPTTLLARLDEHYMEW